jgi:hypothetical protein
VLWAVAALVFGATMVFLGMFALDTIRLISCWVSAVVLLRRTGAASIGGRPDRLIPKSWRRGFGACARFAELAGRGRSCTLIDLRIIDGKAKGGDIDHPIAPSLDVG